jgi:hypothetical protein
MTRIVRVGRLGSSVEGTVWNQQEQKLATDTKREPLGRSKRQWEPA